MVGRRILNQPKDQEPTEEEGLVAAGRGDVPDEAHALTTNVGQLRVPTTHCASWESVPGNALTMRLRCNVHTLSRTAIWTSI